MDRDEMTPRQVHLMCHALGWPEPKAIRRRKGVLRREWQRCLKAPHRNGYAAAGKAVAEWMTLVEKGWAVLTAKPSETMPYHYFAVTPLTQERLREHLLIVRAFARAGL